MLYIIITGRHPLYENGDNIETYLAKLKNPVWAFPPHFSLLARSLFLNLVKSNPMERYTAKESLQHPWITRKPGPIPQAYEESYLIEKSKTKLNTVLLLLCTVLASF